MGRVPDTLPSPFDQYLAEIGRFPLLTARQEIELALRIQRDHDRAAAEELNNANLRFVVARARNFANPHLSVVDLVGVGNDGLWRAVWKYDPYRKFAETGKTVRFTTCARWWIDQAILRELQTFGQFCNYPAQIGAQVGKVIAAYRVQQQEGHVNLLAIARQYNLDLATVMNMIAINTRMRSLDQPLGEDEDTLGDILPEPPAPPTPTSEPSPMLAHALSCLSDDERQVVLLSFGFTGRTYQQREIATLIGKTPDTVRRLQGIAMERLQHLLLATVS